MSEIKKTQTRQVTTYQDLAAHVSPKKMPRGQEGAPRHARHPVQGVRARLQTREDEERRDIARALCDVTGLELLRLADVVNESSMAPSTGEIVRQHLERLAARLRDVSRRMYPYIVDDLGLVAAMRSSCQVARAASGVDIRFAASKLPSPLPRASSLCLYRVLEEALRNAVIHASSPDIAVSLQEWEDDIALTVADRGVGFDPLVAHDNGGLGLIRMFERADDLGGRLVIASEIGTGTRIVCSLPLKGVPPIARSGN